MTSSTTATLDPSYVDLGDSDAASAPRTGMLSGTGVLRLVVGTIAGAALLGGALVALRPASTPAPPNHSVGQLTLAGTAAEVDGLAQTAGGTWVLRTDSATCPVTVEVGPAGRMRLQPVAPASAQCTAAVVGAGNSVG